MSGIDLEDVELPGPEPTESVKLNGPPGAGKTTKTAARISKLVQNHDVQLGEVVNVTYRRSLAQDVLERLAEWGLVTEQELETPHENRTRWIATVHAVAHRVVGVKMRGQFADYSDKRDFFDTEYNVAYDADGGRSYGKSAMAVITWLRNNEVSLDKPHRATPYAELQSVWPNHPPITEVASKWESYKDENNIYDFHEVLEKAYEVDEYPGYGDTPSVVVADEYHDVYPLMDKVLRKWLAAADVAVVAGDPLQVVNAHEGSDPRYFERIDLDETTLPESYRVPQEHWEAASAVLTRSHDTPEIEVKEGGSIERTESPKFRKDNLTDDWDLPVGERYAPDWVVDEYGGSKLFLTRTRSQAQAVGEALQRAGVIYKSQKGAGGWDSSPALLNLYNALRKLEDVEVEEETWGGGYKLDSDALLTGEEAYRILRHTMLTHSRYEDREDIDSLARKFRSVSEVEVSEFIDVLSIDWWETYTGASAVNNLTRINDAQRIKLGQALSENEGVIDLSEVDISVLTIHASKGYEADTVVVYDGITSKIKESINSDQRMMDNENRTWYVALTRSRENLIILDDAFDWCHPYLPHYVGRNKVFNQ